MKRLGLSVSLLLLCQCVATQAGKRVAFLPANGKFGELENRVADRLVEKFAGRPWRRSVAVLKILFLDDFFDALSVRYGQTVLRQLTRKDRELSKFYGDKAEEQKRDRQHQMERAEDRADRAADRAVNAMTGFVMGAVFGALLF